MIDNKNIKILIADDDQDIRRLISIKIGKMGFAIEEAADGEECISRLCEVDDIDAVILDIMMPEMDGMDVLDYIHNNYPEIPVVMLTSSKDVDVAVRAMKSGAYDYLTKPVDINRINTVLRNALSISKLKNEIGDLRSKVRRNEVYRHIIGESDKLHEIIIQLDRAFNKEESVLLLGESGTGKELLAKAIHNGSRRKDGPFVIVNCASITHELAESFLFGHKRDSFTWAVQDHAGYFEQAHKGTIFFDEIGDMNIEMQAKVIRVLEDKKVRRIGEKQNRDVDFRIISAISRDLAEAVAAKEFRSDLFFRLEEYPLHVPPLRERKDDIPLLAEFFLKEFCDFCDIKHMSINDDIIKILMNYSWPGNIRELKNVILRAAALSPGLIIENVYFSDIEGVMLESVDSEEDSETEMNENSVDQEIVPLDILERNAIEKAYHHVNGNADRAAVLLAISRATLYRKLKKYRIN